MELLQALWNGYAAAMVEEACSFASDGDIENPCRALHTRMGPLLEAVRDIAVTAISSMGLDADALGMRVVQVDSLDHKEPGAFATLIIQRSQLGCLRVEHSGEVKLIDFTQSRCKFHYAAFLSGCHHELALPALGPPRTCLFFSLISDELGRDSVPQPYDTRAFLKALLVVKAALAAWFKDLEDGTEGAPEKYVIPLENQYKADELKFSNLRGHDKLLLELLSCNSVPLELHLCILSRSKDELYNLSSWVGIGDKPVNMRVKKLKVQEVLRSSDDTVFKDGEDGAASIVIWPRARRLNNVGFAKSLQILEAMVAQREPSATAFLQELADFAAKYPSKAWEYEVHDYGDDDCDNHCDYDYLWGAKRVCKMLQLCLEAGGLHDCLQVIRSLRETGIESAELVWKLVLVVQKCYSSPQIREAICQLIILGHQAFNYAALALELIPVNKALAVDIAKKTQALVLKDTTLQELKFEERTTVARMVINLLDDDFVHEMLDILEDEEDDSKNLEEVLKLKRLAGAMTASLPRRKAMYRGKLMGSAYLKAPLVLEVLEFGDEELLELLVNRVKEQSRKEAASCSSEDLIEELVASPNFTVVSASSSCSTWAIREMVGDWIALRKEEARPEFSWRQAAAKFPEHPKVEEFLRGTKDVFYYMGPFEQTLCKAREFAASKCFDGELQDGFSAKAEAGGRGSGVFVEIRKTRDAYNELLKRWEQRQQAAASLVRICEA